MAYRWKNDQCPIVIVQAEPGLPTWTKWAAFGISALAGIATIFGKKGKR
jgi:hypothetical protein